MNASMDHKLMNEISKEFKDLKTACGKKSFWSNGVEKKISTKY
jgi:hypothetical protein